MCGAVALNVENLPIFLWLFFVWFAYIFKTACRMSAGCCCLASARYSQNIVIFHLCVILICERVLFQVDGFIFCRLFASGAVLVLLQYAPFAYQNNKLINFIIFVCKCK